VVLSVEHIRVKTGKGSAFSTDSISEEILL
jgi:hypothetical protein